MSWLWEAGAYNPTSMKTSIFKRSPFNFKKWFALKLQSTVIPYRCYKSIGQCKKERRNSIADAMELPLSCTNLPKWHIICVWSYNNLTNPTMYMSHVPQYIIRNRNPANGNKFFFNAPLQTAMLSMSLRIKSKGYLAKWWYRLIWS